MNADWLAKYPRAAAMLQGDDDVLLYEPQSCSGLDRPEGAESMAWLEADGIGVNLAGNGLWQAFYQDREADLPAGEAFHCYGINDQPTPGQAVETLRAILASQGVVPRRYDGDPRRPEEAPVPDPVAFDRELAEACWRPARLTPTPLPEVRLLPDRVEIWHPDRAVRIESDDVEEIDRGDW
jgi:hypothetical protein